MGLTRHELLTELYCMMGVKRASDLCQQSGDDQCLPSWRNGDPAL